MASPSGSDQGKKSPTSTEDRESSQDSTMDVKIKDEPSDTGYEPDQPASNENHSSSNSRASSPPASGPRETDSPSQDAEDASSPRSESQQAPVNDVQNNSSIRSQLQGSNNSGKKVDTVQNIVEGLLKKNATLLAMNDAEGLRPNSRRLKGQEISMRKGDIGQSTVFPISPVSQARLVASSGNSEKKIDSGKARFLRPKSPTRKCESILRDDTQLSYALMEAKVGDQEIENVFRVQRHELVCALSVRSYVGDRDRVVAVLDKSYYWCNFCSFSSTNKELLTQHIMDHRFRCNYCPYESFCRSDILRHMAATHSEFSAADTLNFCTFLSDYLRVKSRADKMENNLPCVDPDNDIKDLDKDEMEATLIKNEKRKREDDEEARSRPDKKSCLEDSKDSSETTQADRHGKSRKSLNPRRHPQPSENDYDTFEMEVEEINDYVENGSRDYGSDRVMYPSHVSEDDMDHGKAVPTSAVPRMQIIPSIQDGGRQGFTTTHISSPAPQRPGPGRPPKTPCPFNKTKRTSGSTSLYWSCGYCDFQSGSQAEIKEHSNRTHPGKPHRCKKKLQKRSKVKKSGNKVSKGHYNRLSSSRRGNPHPGREQQHSRTDACREMVSCVGNGCHQAKCNVLVSTTNVDVCKTTVNANVRTDECCGDKGLSGKQTCKSQSSQEIKCRSGLNKTDDKIELENKVKENQITFPKPGDASVECNIMAGQDGSLEKSGVNVEKSNQMGDNLDGVLREHEVKSNNALSKDTLKADENVMSPPLKITFKTVGHITTCSMNKGKQSKKGNVTVLSDFPKSNDTPSKEEVRWEGALVNSDDDESKNNIPSNLSGTALSVCSDNGVIESSVVSPDRDTLAEPKLEKEGQTYPDRTPPLVHSEPICNENVKKLSPPCEEEKPLELLPLPCVPARSAAVKAITKMKPALENEPEERKLPSGCQRVKKQALCHGMKKQVLKSKHTHLDAEVVFCGNPQTDINLIKSWYTCCHCSEMKVVTLQKMRSHLRDVHPHQQPVIINFRKLPNGKKKKTKLFACLVPACKKVVKSAADLEFHRNQDHRLPVPAKPKERKTMNSLSTSSVSSITEVLHHPVSLPLPGRTKSIPDCCVKLHHLDMDQLHHFSASSPKQQEIGRYECLYCTDDIFHCDQLSNIKLHHFSEHPSQLLVMRDKEAKKCQLPSRIYLCDDMSCDFMSSCRNDIIAHASSHNANCTCVYECPSCGWYSSSYPKAEDHLQMVHADEENISLVRMQLSVDQNGQTSKKILR